jgi:hypothetical protein
VVCQLDFVEVDSELVRLDNGVRTPGTSHTGLESKDISWRSVVPRMIEEKGHTPVSNVCLPVTSIARILRTSLKANNPSGKVMVCGGFGGLPSAGVEVAF